MDPNHPDLSTGECSWCGEGEYVLTWGLCSACCVDYPLFGDVLHPRKWCDEWAKEWIDALWTSNPGLKTSEK